MGDVVIYILQSERSEQDDSKRLKIIFSLQDHISGIGSSIEINEQVS